MKILFIDLMSPMGHKNYNYGILRALTDLCQVDVLVRKDFLELENNKIMVRNTFYIPDEFIPEILMSKSKNMALFKVKYRINQFICIQWIKKNFELGNYDLIFFSSVDIISYSLATKFIENRCVFVEHGISDMEHSAIKRFFLKRVNKNFELVVLETYIKNYLEDILKYKNKLRPVVHPLPSINVNDYNELLIAQEKKIIFAPGFSNEESFIEYLINNKSLIPEGFKIVLRSRKRNAIFDNLVVYNSRITDKEYYGTMINSSYILLPYEETYNYKTSGVFFESAHFNKPLLLNSNNTLKNYNDTYPGIIKLYDGFEDFFMLLSKLKEKEMKPNVEMFNKILSDYSDETIKLQIKDLLNG